MSASVPSVIAMKAKYAHKKKHDILCVCPAYVANKILVTLIPRYFNLLTISCQVLHNLYALLDIITVVRPRSLRWVVLVVRVENLKNTCKTLVGKHEC
jgi:hypothetical protein